MYDKRMREAFWTKFGQYMALQASASGERVNWINYKTGVRQVQLRMEVNDKFACIVILLAESDPAKLLHIFNQFLADKNILDACAETAWQVGTLSNTEAKPVGVLFQELHGVNINLQSDWPAIISFLKPLLVCFDLFWNRQKDLYELIAG